ncbi:MAG: TraR/DksA C4-type zinc finger protein [Chloroflexia bacterium]|nr:TraR/DksA C4-type zinc finger protein [Chloroflexia bacterium]
MDTVPEEQLSQVEVQEEKVRLERELQEAQAEMVEIEKRLEYRGDYSLGEGDPAIHTWELNLALAQRLQEKIDSIHEALRRIEAGSYGICRKCGKRIDRARLEIIPQAQLCIECARERGK